MEAVCLSVKNPISYLITKGIKDVENRTWKTSYRGRLYIHSSGEPWPYVAEEFIPVDVDGTPYEEKYNQLCREVVEYYEGAGVNLDNGIPDIPSKFFCQSFAIIGYVDLVDCVKGFKSPFAMRDHWHWVLKNPVHFDKPITGVKGKLSLWRYEI